jgi:anti-sigma factor (TIGR02949 family)
MNARCAEVRLHLLDYQRGVLGAAAHEALRAHLDECRECAREDAAEQALGEALDRRLPQYPAPVALKRRLAAAARAGAQVSPRPRRLRPALAAAGLAAAVLLGVLAWPGIFPPGVDPGAAIVREVVNDHLRILEPGRRLDVQSQDVHQVRPWFGGRLDFAPVVPFAGDDEYPLRGGAIERFLDRRAAVFVYGRRLHVVSLLVFRSDGLAWPSAGGDGQGTAMLTVRGFNVLTWRNRDLGYALVSDLNAAELATLATRLAAPPVRQ